MHPFNLETETKGIAWIGLRGGYMRGEQALADVVFESEGSRVMLKALVATGASRRHL